MTNRTTWLISFSAVILMIFLAYTVNISLYGPSIKGYDIYYSYVEGQRLVNGENPYGRILQSDMRQNQKYATYFPVFYELSALSQKMGLVSVESWIGFWRMVFMAFEFAIALLLYLLLAKRNMLWGGVFAVAFWLFNRWTLNVIQLQNLDFIPVFLLVLSLHFFPRKKWLSLFLFSLSLGFKQVAIFAAPIYLIWVFQAAGKDWFKQLFKSGLVIASVPFVTAIPFLLWDAKAFVKSILFSATRLSGSYSEVASIDTLMKWDGLPGRAVMLTVMLLAYLFIFQKRTPKYASVFAVMMVFIAFNNSLFPQYVMWVIPLFLLTLSDFQREPNE